MTYEARKALLKSIPKALTFLFVHAKLGEDSKIHQAIIQVKVQLHPV